MGNSRLMIRSGAYAADVHLSRFGGANLSRLGLHDEPGDRPNIHA
jgi:hypothetical protein